MDAVRCIGSILNLFCWFLRNVICLMQSFARTTHIHENTFLEGGYMSKKDYADFRSKIAEIYEQDPHAIILGNEAGKETVVSVSIPPGSPKFVVQGGRRTGSSFLPRTIAVALVENTSDRICIISQTDYSALAEGTNGAVVFVDASDRKGIEKLFVFHDLGIADFDTIIVDGKSKMKDAVKSRVGTFMHWNEGRRQIIIDDNPEGEVNLRFRRPENSNRNYGLIVLETHVRFVIPFWVPLGEKLPNYMEEAVAKRERDDILRGGAAVNRKLFEAMSDADKDQDFRLWVDLLDLFFGSCIRCGDFGFLTHSVERILQSKRHLDGMSIQDHVATRAYRAIRNEEASIADMQPIIEAAQYPPTMIKLRKWLGTNTESLDRALQKTQEDYSDPGHWLYQSPLVPEILPTDD